MKRVFTVKNPFWFIVGIIIVFIIQYISPSVQKDLSRLVQISPTSSIVKEQTRTTVIRIVDGDTIELADKTILRYIGIDTPELHHPTKSIQCFGNEAMLKNKELVEGKDIIMEQDVSNTDRYKRLLRYVWLAQDATSSAKGLFVNDYLIREGYAYAATFPPDVMYQDVFKESQQYARENKIGLWNVCK